MSSLKLLTEVKIGDLMLKNRMALAPLTRGRSTETHVPTEIMIEYYKQRSTAGLVITEATGISRQGMGWYCAPGIWSDEQVDAWKKVVEGVHGVKGTICLQLWHMGRQAHSDVTGEPIVSASPIAIEGEVTAVRGEKKPYETPKELSEEEVRSVVQDYKKAAENAKKAGFDMIEVHSANGYLIDQFLQSSTNKRQDAFGGTLEKRLQFMIEVVEAVLTVWPKERVGIRLSPNGAFGSMGSEDNTETFTAAIKWLAEKQLAYIHVMDGLGFGYHEKCPPFTLRNARDIINTTSGKGVTSIMGNVGYTKELAEERLQADDTDMIAFGRPYISNPDLPQRFEKDAPLNPDAEYKDWWGLDMGAKGYIDWPTLEEAQAKES